MMIPSKQIAASSATMPSKLDPHILKSKAITMQRIGLCVANGNDHLFAVQGEVELTNALRFARKMDESYEMTASASTRSHRKAAGRAQVSLFFYPIAGTSKLQYWLLRTAGSVPESCTEIWLDVRTKEGRLTMGEDYELVRLPVSKKAREKAAKDGRRYNETTWTWRMTSACFQFWKRRIRQAVGSARLKNNKRALRQAVWSLNSAPGARGIRDQIFQLQVYMQQCWKHGQKTKTTLKNQRKKQPLKPLPLEFTLKPRTLAIRGCPTYRMSLCQRRLEAGEKSWFPLRNSAHLRVDVLLFEAENAKTLEPKRRKLSCKKKR